MEINTIFLLYLSTVCKRDYLPPVACAYVTGSGGLHSIHPVQRWSTIWDGLCRHETGEELSNEKKWPKQLFRGVVGDEILHSYMGIVSQTIVRNL